MLMRITGSQPKISIRKRLRPAFSVLLEAFEYSQETNRDRWEFAVEIDRLRDIGLCANDLRWLVRMEYVQHSREVTIDGDNGRQFRPSGDLTFCDRSCFVLTELGITCALESCDPMMLPDDDLLCEYESTDAAVKLDPPVQPTWDADRRELRLNGEIVKSFKWQAVNQEIILAAFQEDGWPPVIDDPLPPQPEQDTKRRLNDTIKALNRRQKNKLMHFHGNGTGEGIRWEAVAKSRRNINRRQLDHRSL